MKIQKIISQNRRDFTAIYECEHCKHEVTQGGYDDAYYHKEVIPNMQCEKCGETSPKDYVPKPTKYEEGYVV